MKGTKTIIGAVAALAAAACGGPQGWSVRGTVAGADEGDKLAVEACNAGYWYVLDSVAVGKDGKFDYRAEEAAPSAEIMRLTMPGKGSVYFPVAGDDAIVVEADAATFGVGHRLSGSGMAAVFGAVDSIAATTSDIAELQRKLSGFVVGDTTGIVAYYVVGKSVGNRQVFDPNDSYGNRIYGAAAQVYEHYHPADNHGVALKTAYFEGRRALGKLPVAEQPTVTYDVAETKFIDIKRYDSKGEARNLSDCVKDDNVVILSLTAYDRDFSPAYNKVLNDIYELYHSRGLEIYQVAFDESEAEWKEAARNLPWVSVWNSPSDGADVLRSYNTGALPMSFIISGGALDERVVDPKELAAKVARKF